MAVDTPVRERTIDEYKSDEKPTWCPGCGDFGVLNAVYRAMRLKNFAPHEVVAISGIGCSSRIPYFISTYGFHGIHGRTMPIATGVRVARPELKTLVFGGDGDAFAIGAGHFVHAMRRNLDITYVVMDNAIYGLTKGQTSPTSGAGFSTLSTPQGNPEQALNPLMLALVRRRHLRRPGLLRRAAEAGRPDRAGHRAQGLLVHRRLQPLPHLQQGQHLQVLQGQRGPPARRPRLDRHDPGAELRQLAGSPLPRRLHAARGADLRGAGGRTALRRRDVPAGPAAGSVLPL